ncbi:MAG: hypothetical protein HZA54_02525 [Planctomycetes bacterium]|nr:hypothetical protein [Planctomycetota bacterium]
MAGSKLGEMLVREKSITDEQLKMAVTFQKSVGGRLSAILVKLGFISDENLTAFIARKQGLQVAELDAMIIPINLVKKVPRKMVEEHIVIPIAYKDGVLTLATSDPTDFESVEAIQFATNCKIEVALATKASITRALNRVFAEAEAPEHKSKEDLLKDLTDAAPKVATPRHQAFDDLNQAQLVRKVLIPLLLEKGVITEADLNRKARELEQHKEG